MSASAESYQGQLLALLPTGPLWRFKPGGILRSLFLAFSDALARVHARACGLRAEADPRTTYELLPDWEASCGLPDGCLPSGGSIAQRQAAVVARITAVGGCNDAYFIALAAQLGFTAEVVRLGPNEWRMDVAEDVAITWATAGDAVAGDPIRSWGATQLECLINRYKPAHEVGTFAYGVP